MLENAGKGLGLLKTWSRAEDRSHAGIRGKEAGATSGLPGPLPSPSSLPLLPFYHLPSLHPGNWVWLAGIYIYTPLPVLFIISSLPEHIISCCSFRTQRQSSELLFQRHTRIKSRDRNYRSFSTWAIFIPPGHTGLR